MASVGKPKGQAVLEGFMNYIGRYAVLNNGGPDQLLVCALWAMATHVFERFPAVAYLHVMGAGPGCGKTTVAEVIGSVCRGAITSGVKLFTTIRMLSLCRWAREHNYLVTTIFDEAERLSHAAFGDMRSMLADGYRRGATHGVLVGGVYEEYLVYWPKVFVTIGDIADVLRDRSLPVWVEWAQPDGDFYPEAGAASQMAEQLIQQWGALVPMEAGGIELVAPEFLTGRNREILTALWSVALFLKLDAGTMARLTAALVDMTAKKLAGDHTRVADPARARMLAEFGGMALRHLARVLEGEKGLASVECVSRMKLIPEGPWRGFRGIGLDADTLAALVGAYGVHPRAIRTGSKETSRVVKGYKSFDVTASLPKERV